MRFGKLLTLLIAAGSGAAVYKVRHPEVSYTSDSQYQQPQDDADPGTYSTLTGEGSLYQTLKHARDGASDNSRQRSMFGSSGSSSSNTGFSGGIGKVGGVEKSHGRNNYGSYGNSGNISYMPADDLEILQAAAKGDKLALQRRIAAGVKIDSRDSERRTPLMYAAANGFEEIINRLIAAGANPNFKDRKGNNAFDYAAGRGLVETVQYLLKRTHSKDNRHYIEYAQTIRATYTGDVSLLPSGKGKLASVNRITPDGQAPLHIAAGNGSTAMIEELIKRGAEVNLTNRNEQTPLHWAAWNNQVGSVNVLLEHGACIYQGEAGGNTPLMLAVQSNSKEVAKLLVDKGAETNVVNKQGKTAAMQAEDRGFRDILKILK